MILHHLKAHLVIPVITAAGEPAADIAMVAKNDLSPHSAAKTRLKV